jgi:outer membrane biosynthesis protein TonB
MEDKFFRYAIIISLVVHAGFFTHFYLTHRTFKFWEKPSEVSYSIIKPEEKPAPNPAEQKLDNIDPDLVQKIIETIKLPADDQLVGKVPQPPKPESLLQEPGIMDNVDMFDRKPERLKGVKVTKEVSIPMLQSEKINTPSYITYYQIVRDRIRDRAYSNYTKLSVGEVFVTFVIKSDGSLSGLQVLEAKSAANSFLREVGLKSVQEAASFPPFPKDLTYPELTFNVSISFQYREE